MRLLFPPSRPTDRVYLAVAEALRGGLTLLSSSPFERERHACYATAPLHLLSLSPCLFLSESSVRRRLKLLHTLKEYVCVTLQTSFHRLPWGDWSPPTVWMTLIHPHVGVDGVVLGGAGGGGLDSDLRQALSGLLPRSPSAAAAAAPLRRRPPGRPDRQFSRQCLRSPFSFVLRSPLRSRLTRSSPMIGSTRVAGDGFSQNTVA